MWVFVFCIIMIVLGDLRFFLNAGNSPEGKKSAIRTWLITNIGAVIIIIIICLSRK